MSDRNPTELSSSSLSSFNTSSGSSQQSATVAIAPPKSEINKQSDAIEFDYFWEASAWNNPEDFLMHQLPDGRYALTIRTQPKAEVQKKVGATSEQKQGANFVKSDDAFDNFWHSPCSEDFLMDQFPGGGYVRGIKTQPKAEVQKKAGAASEQKQDANFVKSDDPLAAVDDDRHETEETFGWYQKLPDGEDVLEQAPSKKSSQINIQASQLPSIARFDQEGAAQTAPVVSKTEAKQEDSDNSLQQNQADSSSSQTTSQATIQNIQDKLSQGNVEALRNQLKQPTGTIAADSEMGIYLQEQALTDMVKAQAQSSEKAELKDSQRADLIQAMEEVLKTDPLAVVRPNKEEGGATPLDTAIKLGLPENVINRLQQAEQVVHDDQINALQEKVVQLAKKSQNPEEVAELASSLMKSVAELKAIRNKVNQLPATVASTPLASSSVSTSTANTAVLVNAPVGLSAAQQAQIELGQQFLRIKLTQIFVEALAIKYGLVDGFNQSRTAAVAKGAFILIASLVPIPGASLLAQGIVEGVEFGMTKGAQAAVEDHDKELRTGRIGKEIETIEQAAAYVAVLTKDLTRRFQLVFAQLAPESLEVFVNRVVDRMVDYWDMMPEKLKEAKASRELLHERLVDCTQKTLQLLPSSPSQVLTQNQQFDNLIENLLLGVSLWDEDREIDASGRLAGVAAGTGKLAKAAGFVIGDRAVYFQGPQSSQRVAVRHICRHAPAVTWTGLNHHRHGPTYYYGNPLIGSNTPIDKSLPPLYLSEAECNLRNYTIDQNTPAPLSLKIPPKELSLSDAQKKERELEAEIVRLRQEVETERARADVAETRAYKAETALGQVKEAKGFAPQKLPVPETKTMSTTQAQPKWNPRAIGQIPVSPSSPSQPPNRSLSVQSGNLVTPGSPTVVR